MKYDPLIFVLAAVTITATCATFTILALSIIIYIGNIL